MTTDASKANYNYNGGGRRQYYFRRRLNLADLNPVEKKSPRWAAMVTSLACYAAIAIDKSLTIDDGIHSMMAEL